jgi:hypothetical protein
MESRVTFYDGMDNDPADYTKMQDYIQGSFDDLVGDSVTADRKYAGLVATKTAAAVVTVSVGRLYSAGKVYVMATPLVKDFTTSLPVSTKKIATIAIWGTEVDTDNAPREFLINEETGASEPRTVSQTHARVVNIGVSYGSESPDPVSPILDAGVLAVATVVLSPTGVVSVTMVAANALDSVSSVSARAAVLEAFEAVAAPQIVSLGSDLAKLASKTTGLVGVEVYGRSLARLAVLEAKNGIPSAAADSAADFFLSQTTSDLTNANFQAKVQEGIRFADLNANVTALGIFNSLDANAKIVGGVLFPAYDRAQRMTVGPQQGEVQVSAYTYQTHAMVQKMMSRTRIRYGTAFTVCTNSAWWLSGQYDPLGQTFQKDGETFAVDSITATQFGAGHDAVRVEEFWYDTYEEPYWEEVTTSYSVPGAQVAETFLNANDMWLDAVGLTFTRLAATGGITLAICEVDRGSPDLANAVCKVDVDRSALVLNAETQIPVGPIFLKGGTRYAFVVITAADHWLATTQGSNFPQGTFFYVLDGAYQQGDGTRDLCFSLYAAKFRQSRTVIPMTALTLSGGITTIDILAASIVPGSTDLTYEVQVGSSWLPLQQATVAALTAGGNIPPLLPLRAVFTGTPDVMPCVTLTNSQVKVSIPRTTLAHISTARTLPAPSTSIRVIARLEGGFDAAHHTALCKLRSGAGYTTLTSASSFVDVAQVDGAIERTWLFNLGSALSSYKIEFDATTDSALNIFHFAWRKDYAL